jgi:hypothetical protein
MFLRIASVAEEKVKKQIPLHGMTTRKAKATTKSEARRYAVPQIMR